jgi:xanthine dehydrogenase YagS FAD-binding subunit
VKAFRYDRPRTLDATARALAEGPALLKASGIDVLDRLKERVDEPDRVVALVDVAGLDAIALGEGGVLRVGALTTLADVAANPDVRRLLPAVAHAAGEAASPQLRNRATLGGNLAQHTRCGYYRHRSFPCAKRGAPTCPVLAPGAVQETAGIFDNALCASAHPSSVAPAVGACGGAVVVRGPAGERRLPLEGLYEPPRRGKASDTTLGPADVIVAVEFAPADRPSRSGFHEVRQRAAFDWALVSCAAGFDGGEVAVKTARVWLSAVAPYPLRSAAAEKALVGKPFSEALADAAGEAAAKGATPLPGSAYKVHLARVAVKRALMAAWERR